MVRLEAFLILNAFHAVGAKESGSSLKVEESTGIRYQAVEFCDFAVCC